MRTKLIARVTLLGGWCLAGGTTVFAQLQTGRILGTVYDPQHAGIPGATVTVANLATNVARTVTTTAEGQYVVTPLDPGTYRVSAEIQGVQPAGRDGVELTGGLSVVVDAERER